MSYISKCITHDLRLRIPESDNDYILFSKDVDDLILHLGENPSCKFLKVDV